MKNEDQNDFLEFLTSHEAPPASLKALTHKDIVFSLDKKKIILKFLMYQLIGAMVTLSFCPQFGVGFAEGHGIAHFFRIMGDGACAAFCGSLFLCAGSLSAFLGMESDQIFWIWKHYKLELIFIPASMWAGLMLFNITLKLESESINYQTIWLVSAILIQQILFYSKTRFYSGVLKKVS